MKILSTLRAFMKQNEHRQKIFHKNLFLDNFNANSDDFMDEYEDSEDECSDEETSTFYSDTYEANSKIYELKHLPVPLTETIAEVLQEFSHDKFLVDDISFIFEMSRKRAISPYALVIALIYLNRLKIKTTQTKDNGAFGYFKTPDNFDKYSASYLTNTELCLVSLLLASKYLIDEGETEEIYNDDWASVSELSVKEINKLEKSFLRQLDWELYVSSEEFWKFTNSLTDKITRKKVKLQYNQCTYSDLDVLLSNSNEFSLEIAKKYLHLLTKLIIVCSSTIVYVAFSSFFVSACIIYLKNQITTHATIHNHQVNEHKHSENMTLAHHHHQQPTTAIITADSKSFEETNSLDYFVDEINLMEHNQNSSVFTNTQEFRKYECNYTLNDFKVFKPNENFIQLSFMKNVYDQEKEGHFGHVKFKKDHILRRFLL